MKTYKWLLSPAVSAVYTQTNSLLPWLNTCCCVPATCVCACHCMSTCVCLETQNYVASLYNMCMTSYPDCLVLLQMKNEWKKGKCMHSLSVCVCPYLSETVYAHTLCMGICDWIALTSCCFLTCNWRQHVVWVGWQPHELFNSKYILVSHDCDTHRRTPQWACDCNYQNDSVCCHVIRISIF